jgi:hypothetical protein
VTDAQGAHGNRGLLTLGGKEFATVDRADGYKWLRPGEYECEMAYWTSSSGKKAKAIRVLGDYSAGRIYIHPANWPHQLAGCIAPGLYTTNDGVGESGRAISQVFDLLGGFEIGKRFSLSVLGPNQ